MRAKCRKKRNVAGIATACDQNSPDPWLIVPRIHRKPLTVKIDFDPGIIIHWRRIGWYANIPHEAIGVAGWNIQRPAQCDNQMREIAAYADTLIIGFQRRPC